MMDHPAAPASQPCMAQPTIGRRTGVPGGVAPAVGS